MNCRPLFCFTFVFTFVATSIVTWASGQEFALPVDRPTKQATTANGDPVISPCQIDLVEDVQLPALDAGVLLHLGVKEGDRVKSEAVIARVDDREPIQQRRAAAFAYNAAIQRAKNGIPEQFALAQYEVAVETLEELNDANRRLKGTVTESDVRQAKAEVKSAKLRIKNAEQDRKLAELDAETSKVDVETTEMMIDRRVIRAPFDGEVVEVFRQQQEWVSPGDPILRLIRLDTLKVEGLVNVDQYSFAQLKGCEVTVKVPTPGGNQVIAPGRVVWVDPILMRVSGVQVAKIRAEITNRREQGEWLIHPRRQATMTIHLGTGGLSAAKR